MTSPRRSMISGTPGRNRRSSRIRSVADASICRLRDGRSSPWPSRTSTPATNGCRRSRAGRSCITARARGRASCAASCARASRSGAARRRRTTARATARASTARPTLLTQSSMPSSRSLSRRSMTTSSLSSSSVAWSPTASLSSGTPTTTTPKQFGASRTRRTSAHAPCSCRPLLLALHKPSRVESSSSRSARLARGMRVHTSAQQRTLPPRPRGPRADRTVLRCPPPPPSFIYYKLRASFHTLHGSHHYARL
mmetsp:Transcript_6618/g.19082  ORF Transcript_6618/g.19082 Transcript_6618/m.19082 type:complete len:253 (-) Transcript_6618:19-777(-)